MVRWQWTFCTALSKRKTNPKQEGTEGAVLCPWLQLSEKLFAHWVCRAGFIPPTTLTTFIRKTSKPWEIKGPILRDNNDFNRSREKEGSIAISQVPWRSKIWSGRLEIFFRQAGHGGRLKRSRRTWLQSRHGLRERPQDFPQQTETWEPFRAQLSPRPQQQNICWARWENQLSAQWRSTTATSCKPLKRGLACCTHRHHLSEWERSCGNRLLRGGEGTRCRLSALTGRRIITAGWAEGASLQLRGGRWLGG